MEGNTITSISPKPKQCSPGVRWCFTLNNYSEEQISSIVPIIEEKCRLGIFGKEVGNSGTPHLQGYIEFKTKGRPMNLFGIKQIHWEKTKGSKADNMAYCSKEDRRPYTWGCKVKKPVKVISEDQLYDWQKVLVDIVKTEPDDRTVHWYWSWKGEIGKTCFCKYLTVKYGAICLHGKGGDVRNGVIDYMKNNDGCAPELIVYPVPRCHDADYVSYEAIENIKDMYFYSGKYEGGMVCDNSPHLIVFANAPPKQDKLSTDRWNIVCIDPENEPKA